MGIHAASALAPLALSEEVAQSVVANGALPPAVELLQNGSDEAKVEVARFLMNLTDNPQEIGAVLAAGVLGPLLALVAKGTPHGKARAFGSLRNIAKDAANRDAIDAAIPLAARPVPGGVQNL